jgi:hypothetical protein
LGSEESATRGDRLLTRWVAGIGLAIIVLCVVAGLAAGLFSLFMIGPTEGRQPLAKGGLEHVTRATANQLVGILEIANYEAHVTVVGGRQTLFLIAIFVGFGLLGAGFCLFAIGAQGAFELNAEKKDAGKMFFSATAPGLLCFVLATGVIVTSLVSPYSMKLERYELDSDPEVIRAQAESAKPHEKSVKQDEAKVVSSNAVEASSQKPDKQ